MGRIARVVIPGIGHHITQRGVRSMNIFDSSDDKFSYMKLLAKLSEEEKLEIHAYCLMDNHVHLLAVPPKENSLSRVIGETHRLYTRCVNFNQKVRGHLFQERYFSCPLDETHYIATARYIERNPVRAKMCKKACDYNFSSAKYHVGETHTDLLLKHKDWPYNKKEWSLLLEEDPDSIDMIRRHTRTGRPVGDTKFIEDLEKRINRVLRPQKPGPKK